MVCHFSNISILWILNKAWIANKHSEKPVDKRVPVNEWSLWTTDYILTS